MLSLTLPPKLRWCSKRAFEQNLQRDWIPASMNFILKRTTSKHIYTLLAGTLLLAVTLGAFLWIRSIGEQLTAPEIVFNRPTDGTRVDPDFVLVHVLLALLAILIVARLLGMFFDRLRSLLLLAKSSLESCLDPRFWDAFPPPFSPTFFLPI
jgi:hypothetical protein